MARIRPVTRLRAGNSSVSGSVYAEHTGSGLLVPASSTLAGTGNVSSQGGGDPEGFAPEDGFSVQILEGEGFVDGSILRITDTSGQGRFGEKPFGAKPVAYLPRLTGDGVDASLSRSAGVSLVSNSPSAVNWQTTEKWPGGPGAVAVDADDSSASPGVSGISNGIRYVFVHKKWGYNVLTDAISTNFKTIRFWTQIGNNSVTNHYIIIGDGLHIGRGAVQRTIEYASSEPSTADSSLQNGSTFFSGLQGEWQRHEVEIEYESEPGAADGVIIPWWNGRRPMNGGRSSFPNWTEDGTKNWPTGGPWTQVYMEQISNNNEPDGAKFYYGPMLVDDSLCRVITSTEESWNDNDTTSQVRDFCVTQEWADDEIDMLLRKGVHDSLSGLYLWVCTADWGRLKIGAFQ